MLANLSAQAAQKRAVARLPALPVAQRPADPLQYRDGCRREGRLVHGAVDLRRLPAGKRPALVRRAVAVRFQDVDRQPSRAVRRPTLRWRLGHVHPHLAQAPRLVQGELAASRVGRVIHFQDHVGKHVLAHDHGGAAGDVATRVQVHRLIRLQDAPPLAAFVSQQQVRGAERLDRRAACDRDERRHLRQALRWVLMVDGGRLAHHGGLGVGIPEFDAALVVRDGVAGDVYRTATRELVDRFRRRGDGCPVRQPR